MNRDWANFRCTCCHGIYAWEGRVSGIPTDWVEFLDGRILLCNTNSGLPSNGVKCNELADTMMPHCGPIAALIIEEGKKHNIEFGFSFANFSVLVLTYERWFIEVMRDVTELVIYRRPSGFVGQVHTHAYAAGDVADPLTVPLLLKIITTNGEGTKPIAV